VIPADLLTLSPLWIAAAASILLLLSIAVKRHFAFAASFSLAAAALGLAAVFRVARLAPRVATSLVFVDGYALFFMGIFFSVAFFIFLIASSYFRPSARGREEFFLLAFVALLGAAVLASSRHFVSLFLGLEVLSVSLYGLISLPLDRRESVEAGIKYLVLASASAAFLIFGAALVYGETGSLDFACWASRAAGDIDAPLFVLGVSLMVVGIGFKLAVVPFHMWTPDVYQGAPAPSAALVATISKGGMLAFLFRFFLIIDARRYPSLVLVFALVAGASMVAGNLLALRQDRIKRILAYSSISHMGYLLVAFLAGGRIGIEAASFYLAAYVITMTAGFGAVALLSTEDEDADRLENYRGLFWSRPGIAAVLTLVMLSFAGIPLTAGFLGKFYVVAAGVDSSLWTLVAILIFTSAIGIFYYLRVILVMYSPPRTRSAAGPRTPLLRRSTCLAGGIALAVLTLLLLWLGVFPSGMIGLIRTAVGSLAGSIHLPGTGGGLS
jgi:NADH-quinone oxidoreductase subunit N